MYDVTRVLSQIEQGDPQAAEKLLPLVPTGWQNPTHTKSFGVERLSSQKHRGSPKSRQHMLTPIGVSAIDSLASGRMVKHTHSPNDT
jgi:hypothetical protein